VITGAYARYLSRLDRLPAPVLTDYHAAIAAKQVWVLGEPVIAVIVLITEENSLLVENVAVSPAPDESPSARASVLTCVIDRLVASLQFRDQPRDSARLSVIDKL